MAARSSAQASVTSLARYAVARQPDVDPFNGIASRDYCNSFWGPGDAGPNIIFARMRGASKATDELRNFWNERCIIEEDYANKLAKLAKVPIGADEIGELRNSFDTLRTETGTQAQNHFRLASQIRDELELPTAQFHTKQVTLRRAIQVPLERKVKEKQVQESYVKKSREKYENDCRRIVSYTQQSSYMAGADLQKVQQKLLRTQQAMRGNEKDFARFTKELQDMLPAWEKEWKEFCDEFQDVEEERMDFMKEILWTYANAVSTMCVADDLSCERIRTTLDQFEIEKDVESFANEYGTGNLVAQLSDFIPSKGTGEPELPPSPLMRCTQYQRVSKRPQVAYQQDDALQNPPPPQQQEQRVTSTAPIQPLINGDVRTVRDDPTYSVARTQASPPPTNPPSHPPPPVPDVSNYPSALAPPPMTASVVATSLHPPSASGSGARDINRVSQPLPVTPRGGDASRMPAAVPSNPPPQEPSPDRVLFYVKALYDYTATIREEFDFQCGDVIAVRATPDDGWWVGELLDEARRTEGRNVFPSNFVCLF